MPSNIPKNNSEGISINLTIHSSMANIKTDHPTVNLNLDVC